MGLPLAVVLLTWKVIAPGAEYSAISVGEGDTFHVVRVDPRKAKLKAVMAANIDRKSRTAASWCEKEKLVAAINLGMYKDDHLTNVGYARDGEHVNTARWNEYRSVLALGPRSDQKDLAPAAFIDLDAPGAKERLDDYETVIQNLRLIASPGKSVWSKQVRKWSESAVAIDKKGNVLFVFARAPHTMAEFNRILLSQPLDVVAAMHVEGGPEASLSVRGTMKLDLNGSYETGFVENDEERAQWAIPNVLGVMR